MIDFSTTAEEAAFRASVREWLAKHLPEGWGKPGWRTGMSLAENVALARRWQRTLYEGGWAGLSWPKEYGGRALSPFEQLMFKEECIRAGAPDQIEMSSGIVLTGPTLIRHGSEEQKKRFLEPILRGDELWCQGFSEPGAGSDLAGLRTRGEVRGDEIVVNGQKVWTSYAQFADWCILLARTDPDAPKHRGLSFLLVDMKTPGITIRPLVEMTGVAWFNEVFFENVRVPRDMVVGEIGQGWEIALTTLGHERGTTVPYARMRQWIDQLAELARRRTLDGPLAADPLVRQELAALAIEVETLRLSTYRAVLGRPASEGPGPESSMLKLVWSELEQRLMQFATALEGPYALLGEHAPQAYDCGRWQYGVLWSRAATIYAGTSEVQRNIIAQRVLGLPRG